jgi:hypothetical protein
MLNRDTFMQDWRERMGAETPLTEQSVVAYVNKREDETTLARNRLLADERPLSEGERAALQFYSQNPSAALLDFGRRISDGRRSTEALTPAGTELLAELDWCFAHGHAGPRTRAVLAAAALTLAGGRAITGAEKARLLQLAQKHRNSASETKASENYTRLERFVASLLSVRAASPASDPGAQRGMQGELMAYVNAYLLESGTVMVSGWRTDELARDAFANDKKHLPHCVSIPVPLTQSSHAAADLL